MGPISNDIESIDHGNSNHSAMNDDDDVNSVLAKRETKLVKCSKLLVIVSLVIAASICGAVVYIYTSRSESKEYKKQFNSLATHIVEFSQIAAKGIFDSIDTMSLTITSHAVDSGTDWPKYTIPSFDKRGSRLLQQVGSRYLWFAPLVTEEQRDEWEKWSVANQGWITKAHDKKGNEENTTEDIIYPFIHRRDWRYPISNWTVYRDEGPANPFYAPSWQGTPFIAPTVNWNAFDLKAFPECFEEMYAQKKAVFSEVTNYGIHSDGGIDTWPQNRLISPVLDGFEESKVVGFLGLIIQWHQFFANMFSHDSLPLQIVIKNDCAGQQLTYTVKGAAVEFVGEGDIHDTTLDDIHVETCFFNGNENVIDFCKSTISIFPTQEFYTHHHTYFPIICASVVIAIFFMVSFVFGCYVFSVEKRQTTVMNTAVKSSAIVSSLFPSQVRNRLMEDQEHKPNCIHASNEKIQSNTESDEAGLSFSANDELFNSEPIADLFESATVLFADIVGFTTWSSSRQPTHVFMLLELLYSSFDKIAKRRGVFKVETIGDCYVAVVGLPKPRSDHAECMSKFAFDCREMMPKVVQYLGGRLGPETLKLGMRFGLHSGPVTGGVLRGEKSRFQLFGDTVNTAARIESTSVCGRIHLSNETASILISRGKGDWVEKRPDNVVAKGKGLMKTWWLVGTGISGST